MITEDRTMQFAQTANRPINDDGDESQQEQARDPEAITLEAYHDILDEIEEQPAWRAIADKEMDYADGNQLDGDLLSRMASIGIPPAVEDMIGPVLLALQGFEADTRTDWRVTPNHDQDSGEIAEALNFKLNTAERESGADRALSEGFRPQIACGIGWVEVARESDPFAYPYRCQAVSRNEIRWDMSGKRHDLGDSRWLRRERWMRPERAALAFPDRSDLFEQLGRGGARWYEDMEGVEGGQSTGLQNAWMAGRSNTIEEDRFFNPSRREICIAELWYRRYVQAIVLRTRDGRVMEFNEDDPAHVLALAQGYATPVRATVMRVRRSYWCGPYLLHDGPTPYKHRHFPYVPMFGFREDRTGVPYGYVRAMKFQQDSINSGVSKLRWGMSVARVERTKGAVDMNDAQLRRQIARPDADIVLNAEHMAKPGARFEVKRDFQLTAQHFQLLNDSRAAIERVTNITSSFQGKASTATSGFQEQQQIEQSNRSVADIMDNFKAARMLVGELLLSMLIEDMGTAEQTVVVEGDAVRPDKTVRLNVLTVDSETGVQFRTNDVQRARLRVALEDVPSTSSYRAQQSATFAEVIKSLPPQYQQALAPFLVQLMDVPNKREVIEAMRAADQVPTPEQIQQQIKEAVDQALTKAQNELKTRDLDIKERLAEAQVRKTEAETVNTGVQSSFSAMQAGEQIAQMPMIAPIADAVMQGAGYQRPNPMGDDPNFPVPEQTAAMNIQSPYIQGAGPAAAEAAAAPPVHQNTSPAFPPVPDKGRSPMHGIETPNPGDNIEGA